MDQGKPNNLDSGKEIVSRLNKYVALSVGVSRRRADELIQSGKIRINDRLATLGDRVQENDQVFLDGKPISPKRNQYILFHKPRGYVCSRRRQGDNPTIYEILPNELRHLKPVGRLDMDSSGLIILTNDGDFAHRMTHPSFKKRKLYKTTLDKPLEPLHQQMINDHGIMLPDGRSQLTLTRQHDGDSLRWFVEMTEGRNRQIRRTFSALGYTVIKLHRIDFGIYTLGDIKRGEYKFIDIS